MEHFLDVKWNNTNLRKKQPAKGYEDQLLQILHAKKEEVKEIDEDRYVLLSLLPAFRKFNEDQKFKTEIMHTMRRVRLSGSLTSNYRQHSQPTFHPQQMGPPQMLNFQLPPMTTFQAPTSYLLSGYFSAFGINQPPQCSTSHGTGASSDAITRTSIPAVVSPRTFEDTSSDISSVYSLG